MGDQENADEASLNNAMANVSLSAATNDNNENNDNLNTVVDNNDLSLDQNNSLVKIYVGSMPPDLDEDGLKNLISENSLPEPETVLVKRGYAFLEFTDQNKADVAISVIDGKKIDYFFISTGIFCLKSPINQAIQRIGVSKTVSIKIQTQI